MDTCATLQMSSTVSPASVSISTYGSEIRTCVCELIGGCGDEDVVLQCGLATGTGQLTYALEGYRKSDKKKLKDDVQLSHHPVRDGDLHGAGRVKLKYSDGTVPTSMLAGLARDVGYAALTAPTHPEDESTDDDIEDSSEGELAGAGCAAGLRM